MLISIRYVGPRNHDQEEEEEEVRVDFVVVEVALLKSRLADHAIRPPFREYRFRVRVGVVKSRDPSQNDAVGNHYIDLHKQIVTKMMPVTYRLVLIIGIRRNVSYHHALQLRHI